MNTERNQILDMLAQGKINASEAADLLDALEGDDVQNRRKDSLKKKRNLRVDIKAAEGSKKGADIKVNVPLSLVKVLTPVLKSNIIPEKARKEISDQGIDFDNIISLVDDITNNLDEMEDIVTVDAKDNNDGATVRVYVE